jgi:hypothetical protein
MAAVDHPHILRVVEADTGGATPYYVAEYCEGGGSPETWAKQRGC